MKDKIYNELIERIDRLIYGETDVIAIMSMISCEVYNAFAHFNWVGFYRVVDDGTLKVGPYQGEHGCLEIPFDRGVCGKCAREQKVQRVNDVSKLDFHIACSADTKAEIVLPVFDSDSRLIAVLDIDSTDLDVFDDVDEMYLTKITELLQGKNLTTRARCRNESRA